LQKNVPSEKETASAGEMASTGDGATADDTLEKKESKKDKVCLVCC